MNTFWKLRITTLIWGLLVIYFFTKNINVTSGIFLVQVTGSTILYKIFIK